MSELLAAKEAAARLHLSIKTIQKWCRQGKLAHSSVGHKGPHNCGDIWIAKVTNEGLLASRFKPAN